MGKEYGEYFYQHFHSLTRNTYYRKQ